MDSDKHPKYNHWPSRKYFLLLPLTIAIAVMLLYWRPVVSQQESSNPVSKNLPDNLYVTSPSNPYLKELLMAYESFLKEGMDNQLAPGLAVAVIQDTSIIYLQGFGLRDALKKDSVDIHTVFRIASVSKCFASLLTGILVDENKLSWDDPVIKYLPGFKLKSESYTRSVTLRHVLSHTMGLPYHAFTNQVDQGVNYDSLVYHLRDLDLVGKPGEIYSYQNVGYSLIGDVIRSVTGKSYEENLKEKIFDPLHMASASSSFQMISKNENTAKPHRFNKTWTPIPISEMYYNVAPAGGINASISDMACWLRALITDPPYIIKRKTEEEIFHPMVRATSRNYNFRRWKPVTSAFYALGWRVINFKDDTLNYHGGYVNGYRSEVALDRKDKLAICVLVNAPGSLADLSIPKFFELYSQRRHNIVSWEKRKHEIVAVR